MDWIKNKKSCTTMYNRNLFTVSYFANGVHRSIFSGRRIRLLFDYAQSKLKPLGIANVCAKPKNSNFKPVTDGYTRPL